MIPSFSDLEKKWEASFEHSKVIRQQPTPQRCSIPHASVNMASPLLNLPQELLIRVASFLTTPELGQLRGTCKGIESSLFESFAYEFFHKRYVAPHAWPNLLHS